MEKTVKAHCNKCLDERNHELLHSETMTWNDEIDQDLVIEGEDTYEMLKCCGCDNIALRHFSRSSLNLDKHGQPFTEVIYYPPAISRKEPEWLHELYDIEDYSLTENIIEGILREIYVALHNNSRRLATMGIRALLEHVMIDKVGDSGSFGGNLKKFGNEGYISQKQKEILEAVLEVGHAAMHRSYNPSEDELNTAISITENLIESIYVHGKRAKRVKEKLPKRND